MKAKIFFVVLFVCTLITCCNAQSNTISTTTNTSNELKPQFTAAGVILTWCGGIAAGRGERLLANSGWPRSPQSHHWRDASLWLTSTGTACLGFSLNVNINNKPKLKDVAIKVAAGAVSYYVGTRIGYYIR